MSGAVRPAARQAAVRRRALAVLAWVAVASSPRTAPGEPLTEAATTATTAEVRATATVAGVRATATTTTATTSGVRAADTATTAAPGLALADHLRLPPGLAGLPFSIEAERLVAEPGRQRWIAEGAVVVRRRGAVLFAERVELDQLRGVAVAEGEVTAVEGRTVLTCNRVEMQLPELIGGVQQAGLRIKSGLPEELLQSLPADQLVAHGRDELILGADVLQRTGPRSMDVEGASFTACDCGEDTPPSWRIRTRSASIDLDSGAWLTLPVFYVREVPILALPAFYFPLGRRRTGLLAPSFGYTPVTGFRAGIPLFLALGESWDATLEPFYLSWRGAGLASELRWAPSRQSRGELRASFVADYGVPDPTVQRFAKIRESPIPRYAISGDHVTRGANGALVADINLLGDPAYLGDFADAFLARQAELSHSRITASQQGSDLRIAGGLALIQDLRLQWYPGAADFREVPLLSERLPGPGEIRYRLAEVRLDALPMPLSEDSPFIGEARLVVHTFVAPRPEVPRFARVDLRPQLSAPLQLPLGLLLEPSLALRMTAWTGRADSEGESAGRIAPVGRVTLSTELARAYGGIAHRIRPALDYVLVPQIWGSAPGGFDARDEIDLLARVSQVRARLGTDLLDLGSGGRIAGLDAWIGSDLGLGGGARGSGLSELVVRGDGSVFPRAWPVQLQLTSWLSLDPRSGSVTQLLGGGALNVPGGHGLQVMGGRMSAQLPRFTLIAPEELVPAGTVDPGMYRPLDDFLGPSAVDRRVASPWSPWQGVSLSAHVRPLEPLLLAGEAVLAFDDREVLRSLGIEGDVALLRNARGIVRWESPCRCWSVTGSIAVARDRPGFQFGFGFDLAQLGGAGTAF